jgi:transcription antitermination factor NusG
MTHISDKKWYAIYTNPRAEKKVAGSLQVKGIEGYIPLQTTIRQWSDRKKKVEEPIFKSYVFVHIQYELEQMNVLSVPGVVKFVRIGKDLSPIRTEIIDAIKVSLMHASEITLTSEKLSIQQPITIIAGPLAGMQGIITQQQGNHYFAIHIEQIGTHLLLKVPAAYLKPL